MKKSSLFVIALSIILLSCMTIQSHGQVAVEINIQNSTDVTTLLQINRKSVDSLLKDQSFMAKKVGYADYAANTPSPQKFCSLSMGLALLERIRSKPSLFPLRSEKGAWFENTIVTNKGLLFIIKIPDTEVWATNFVPHQQMLFFQSGKTIEIAVKIADPQRIFFFENE